MLWSTLEVDAETRAQYYSRRVEVKERWVNTNLFVTVLRYELHSMSHGRTRVMVHQLAQSFHSVRYTSSYAAYSPHSHPSRFDAHDPFIIACVVARHPGESPGIFQLKPNISIKSFSIAILTGLSSAKLWLSCCRRVI